MFQNLKATKTFKEKLKLHVWKKRKEKKSCTEACSVYAFNRVVNLPERLNCTNCQQIGFY